jgi:siroheme synthase-like protein
MPDYFPTLLDLRGRRCLVVGGGEVAARKVRAFLDCGARVVVVSPRATPDLVALADAGIVTLCRRPFRRSDVRQCFAVIAATGQPDVDWAVAHAGRRRGALVNVVDLPAECDFIFPSVLRRGELQIAVSTGGRSPALAREIRRGLEPFFGPEHAALVERMAEGRQRARAVATTPAERLQAGERVVASALLELGVNGQNGERGEPEAVLSAVVPRLTERLVAVAPGRVYREVLRLLERALLQHMLDVARGNQLRAARLLGLNRNTLRKRCRELELTVRRGARPRRPAPPEPPSTIR